MTHRSYQVAVIGGGPAGSATALTLCRLGVPDILLVEAQDYKAVRLGESIPPETRQLLEDLGVWRDFLGEGHEPALGSCSAWGSDEMGYNDFLYNPHGHGWHLDRRRFDAFLARTAEAAGAVVCLKTRCRAIESQGAQGFRIRLEGVDGPTEIQARFLVDATGSTSRLARSLGAVRRFHDRLSYVAAFFKHTRDAFSRLTWLEAVEYGWWYSAMLPAGRVAVAFAGDSDSLKTKALHQPESWRLWLKRTQHLAGHLADCEPGRDSLHVRTAASFVLDHPCGPNWLAVGDAASAYDPISSQGIYKSLLEGLQAGQAIADGLSGESRELERYATSVADRFADYLHLRNHLYDLEQRWPDAPFWARRQARRSV